MFKDTDEELERLKAELLMDDGESALSDEDMEDTEAFLNGLFDFKDYAEEKEEDQDDLLEEGHTQVFPSFPPQPRAYNADGEEVDPDELNEEPDEASADDKDNSDIRKLCVVALFLLMGILIVMGWLYMRYMGLLG